MIVGSDVVNRIIAMMPPGSMESVTLGSRGVGESGYANVTYGNTRRRPANLNEVYAAGGVANETWIVFELYQTTETTKPKAFDKLTDAEGVVWQIKKVDRKMMQLVHVCTCLKNAT